MNLHIKEELEKMNQQAKELAAIYHKVASRSGVSDNEFWVWYALLILGDEYSQQDICDIWSLPKQTINSIISNLSQKGFLFLENVPGTKNRKVIRVTEEGKKYGESIVMDIYQDEQRAFGKMSETKRKMCSALLGEYINNLKDEIYE